MELSMNISTDGYWSLNRLDIAFFDENFFNFFTKDAEISLW
jgi:hypothetical protein